MRILRAWRQGDSNLSKVTGTTVGSYGLGVDARSPLLWACVSSHSLHYLGSPVRLCLGIIALVTCGPMKDHSTVEILGLMRYAWSWDQPHKMQNYSPRSFWLLGPKLHPLSNTEWRPVSSGWEHSKYEISVSHIPLE